VYTARVHSRGVRVTYAHWTSVMTSRHHVTTVSRDAAVTWRAKNDRRANVNMIKQTCWPRA